MRIVVTGANGFVGSHILEAFRNNDQDVTIIAACRNKNKLPSWYKGEVKVGDLRDQAYVDDLVKDADVVCHAAAFTAIWAHKDQSKELYYKPTIQLIDACKKHNVSKFIYTSTTSASAPYKSKDAMSKGIKRKFWPHLCTIVDIEDYLREVATDSFTTVVLRLGIFAGARYGLGVLPLLLPRLKTHLVPWVAGGKTSLPITDGMDIGQSFKLTSLNTTIKGYEAFNIVGPTVPTSRDVIMYIHKEFGYPKPHFGVPFFAAYAFAYLMELINPIVPWNPLITRSIVHLLEEVDADNTKAKEILGYNPTINWKDSIKKQIQEMDVKQKTNMGMAVPH